MSPVPRVTCYPCPALGGVGSFHPAPWPTLGPCLYRTTSSPRSSVPLPTLTSISVPRLSTKPLTIEKGGRLLTVASQLPWPSTQSCRAHLMIKLLTDGRVYNHSLVKVKEIPFLSGQVGGKFKHKKWGSVVSPAKRICAVTVFFCFGLQATCSASSPLLTMGATLTVTSATWAPHCIWLVKTTRRPVPRSFCSQVKHKTK